MLSQERYNWPTLAEKVCPDEVFCSTEVSDWRSQSFRSWTVHRAACAVSKKKGSAKKKREQLKRKGVRLGVTEMCTDVV